MSTLHTLSQSWQNQSWLYEQMAFAADGDAILLLEDAVLAVHSPLTLASFTAKCEASGINVYVLQDDMHLRGIKNQYSQIVEIDYSGFVELCVQYQKQVAW